jgi:hypothetical protein
MDGMRATVLALMSVFFVPLAVLADELDSRDVAACVQRSLPEPDSVREAVITHTDRAGVKTRTGVVLYGRRNEAGQRQLLVRFVQPKELLGSAVLILERAGENEGYFASSELGTAKRLKSLDQASTLLHTNFAYEDLQYLEGFPLGSWKRLEDDDEFGRPVYVVEIRPRGSAYERIVSRIDKETCLPLSVRFTESGNFVSKELSVNGDSIRKVGTSWVPQSAMMRSRRDSSTTQIFVNRTEQKPVSEGMFDPQQLLETAGSGRSQDRGVGVR